MNWITDAFLLITAVLVLAQGISCLARTGRPTHVSWFGGLALSLGALGVVLYVLLSSGALVLSPEFGVAMVQGSPAGLALGFVIGGIAIVAALGWHATRSG